jgi:folate-binding protein YgfZ
MVSNNIRDLAPGEGIYAAVLVIHGKIQADTAILCSSDSLLMILSESVREKILNHLHRHLIADEVEMTDLKEHTVLSLQGPTSQDLLSEMVQKDSIPPNPLDHLMSTLDESTIRMVRATHTGEEGFDLIAPLDRLSPLMSRLERIGPKFFLRWIGTQAQDVLRVEAGIPRYGTDMNEENLLLETGLDHFVSFTKGCYLGQEVVERIRSRGHVNKQLVGLKLAGDEPATRGDPVYAEEKEIGRLTSSVFSPHLNGLIALGYVHRDFIRPGTRVAYRHKGKSLAGEIRSLPFYGKAPRAFNPSS